MRKVPRPVSLEINVVQVMMISHRKIFIYFSFDFHFQDNLPIRIMSSLYIGSVHAGCNLEALRNAGITHVCLQNMKLKFVP